MNRQSRPENRTSGEETRVAIAVVRLGDQVLVGERTESVPLAGFAEFPGGKCLSGESAEDCVVRECREETGLEVIVRRSLCRVWHDYSHGRVHLTFFDCEPASASLVPRFPFRWLRISDALRLRFPEANAPVLAWLRSGAP